VAPTAPSVGRSSFLHDLLARDLPLDRVLASIARALHERMPGAIAVDAAGPLLDRTIAPLSPGQLPELPSDADVGLLAATLESMRARDDRRRRGAFFTADHHADLVIDRATDGWAWPEAPLVCDPACGGGAFLLAAGRLLEARGVERERAVAELVWGVDVDPLAVAVSRASLALWCAADGSSHRGDRVRHADALALDIRSVPSFDLVVGNPPFQSQLATRTARSRAEAARLEARFGDLSRGYADASTLFLVAASQLTRAGGRFSLILPESFLASRDAAPARDEIARDASLVGVWLPEAPLFAASVHVCVPVFEAGPGDSSTIRRWRGGEATEVAPMTGDDATLDHHTWAPLTSDLLGIPRVDVVSERSIGDEARATAGFRDQFYGVAPYVHEQQARPELSTRLTTSGSIDLVSDRWATRTTTFAGSTYTRPVIDLERLRADDPALGRWADQVLVPKVVVATQTKVVELVVDETGEVWPSVPTIAVVAPPERLWPIAAALASPVVTAECLRRHAGTALARDAVKVSARQLMELPLPVDDDAWALGADHLRDAAEAAASGAAEVWSHFIERFARAMGTAYAVDDAVADWWLDRLPSLR